MGKNDKKASGNDQRQQQAKPDESPLDVAIGATMAKFEGRLIEAYDHGAMPVVAIAGEVMKAVLHFMRAADQPEPPATAVIWAVAQAMVGPAPARRQPQQLEPSRNAEGLRTDGPTLAEYVAAGYSAESYPPQDYAVREPSENGEDKED